MLEGESLTPVYRARLILIVAGVVSAIVGSSAWFNDRARNVYTSDARVGARMIAVSSDISGRIVDLRAVAGQRIAADEVLLRLDDRDARHALAAAGLEVEFADAGVAVEKARLSIAARAGESRIGARRSTLSASTADLTAARTLLATAEAEHARMTRLQTAGLVALPVLERAADAVHRARRALRAAEAGVTQREAEIGEAAAEAGETDLISLRISQLEIDARRRQEEAKTRALHLKRHVLASPIDGVVDEVFVEAGEHVAAGQRVALMHDPTALWIDANIKETDVRRVKPGARVRITFDALPGRVWRGRVERIRDATLSEFALIPSANPSGVFTKVTQRIPARIALEGETPPLRAGAMATLRISAS